MAAFFVSLPFLVAAAVLSAGVLGWIVGCVRAERAALRLRAQLDAEADEAAVRWLEEQALAAAESRVLPDTHHLDLSHPASREDEQSRANVPSPSIPKE